MEVVRSEGGEQLARLISVPVVGWRGDNGLLNVFVTQPTYRRSKTQEVKQEVDVGGTKGFTYGKKQGLRVILTPI